MHASATKEETGVHLQLNVDSGCPTHSNNDPQRLEHDPKAAGYLQKKENIIKRDDYSRRIGPKKKRRRLAYSGPLVITETDLWVEHV